MYSGIDPLEDIIKYHHEEYKTFYLIIISLNSNKSRKATKKRFLSQFPLTTSSKGIVNQRLC